MRPLGKSNRTGGQHRISWKKSLYIKMTTRGITCKPKKKLKKNAIKNQQNKIADRERHGLNKGVLKRRKWGIQMLNAIKT